MTTSTLLSNGPAQAPELPDTMRAVVQRSYGAADELAIEEIGLREPEKDEVLVQVDSAGVDRGTWHLMTGRPYLTRLFFGLRRPKDPVLGLDLAGTVVKVGSEVTRFEVGDAVFGIGRGTFAEYACAPEDKLAKRPANITADAASVVAVSGQTALQALREVGQLERGQRVLITGASGGVGTFAVQIARALGASVTGVASARKLDLIRELGATRTIDYATEDFADGSETYDLIVDIGGNTPLRRLRRALTKTGTLVIVGGEGGGRLVGGTDRQLRAVLLSPLVGQHLTTFVAKEDQGLDDLAALIEAGSVVPTLGRVFALEQTADALHHLEAGDARGKIAVRVRAS